MSNKMLRHFVSDIDQFLKRFDKEHSDKTQSQQEEIKKYQHVYFLRDNVIRSEKQTKLWEKF